MSEVIVALDKNNYSDTISFVRGLDPSLCYIKIGLELFTACGPKIVEDIAALGFKIFLDLKFHDIPNTVYGAVATAAKLPIFMINVHAVGGAEMLKAAKRAIDDSQKNILLIGVTVLTSSSDAANVIDLAKICKDNNFDGVVCSAQEVIELKNKFGKNFITVTPGIRSQVANADQKRVMTPKDAAATGSDYLVIGREITQSADPIRTLQELVSLVRQ